MTYDVDKAVDFIRKTEFFSLEALYKALNISGLRYANFIESGNYPSIRWDKTSSIDEFYSFWKALVGSPKITQIKPDNLYKGDIIIYLDKRSKSVTDLRFVLEIDNSNKKNPKYKIWGKNNQTISLSDLKDCFVLNLSKSNETLSIYYNLLFKGKLLNTKNLLASMILACCPDSDRNNGAANCLFAKIDANELQEEINRIVATEDLNVDRNSDIAKTFIEYVFLAPQERNTTLYANDIEMILEGLQNRKNVICGLPTVLQNRLFKGEHTNAVHSFCSTRANRTLFQARFFLVLQYYFLLNRSVISGQSEISKSPNRYDVYTTTFKERVTLKEEEFKRATQIVRYLSNNNDVNIDSLFGLCGYVFDALGRTNPVSRDMEYARYQEFVNCYRSGTLNYYHALVRFKDVNHYAAEALADVYHFGRNFEGFEVGKDLEKAIAILNPFKDYSVSARWALAESHLLLGQSLNDPDSNSHLKQAQDLFVSCGDYHPALNSLSNRYRLELKHPDEKTDSDLREIARNAVLYASEAAKTGWVYAFNNLYSLLSDSKVMELLSDSEGQEVIQQAYDVLKPTDSNNDALLIEKEFNAIKRDLSNGVKKESVKYTHDKTVIEYKYSDQEKDPIDFLVVSAYLGDLWGMNRLGLAYYERSQTDMANNLFEAAAFYGHWGYFNLGMYIHGKDTPEGVALLEQAAKKGNEKAKEILNAQNNAKGTEKRQFG